MLARLENWGFPPKFKYIPKTALPNFAPRSPHTKPFLRHWYPKTNRDTTEKYNGPGATECLVNPILLHRRRKLLKSGPAN